MLLFGRLAQLVFFGAADGIHGGALARHFGVAVGIDQRLGARHLLFFGERA